MDSSKPSSNTPGSGKKDTTTGNTGPAPGTTPATTSGTATDTTTGTNSGKKDSHAPTNKSIASARPVYCTNLETADAARLSSVSAYDRARHIYDKKKEVFEWTENNYRLYRNLDICLDTELTTGNTGLTASVANYNTISSTLYTALTSIVAKVKDLKTKIAALRDQSSILENYKNDQSNATQWSLLTGKNIENCKPDATSTAPRERPEPCKDAETIYDLLISLPKKALVFDVGSLLQSSSDVTGIQTFSNISILTQAQADLTTAGAAFVQQIKSTVTTRITDMAAVQSDLVSAVQDCTNAGLDKFGKSCTATAAHFTVQYLCSPDCGCVKGPDHIHTPRLGDCECQICNICEVVKSNYKN